MEECEALCTRLAIMVNGQFKCLGSPQHLKAKFGEGYTVIATVRPPGIGKDKDAEEATLDAKIQKLMDYIEEVFPGSVLKDLHHGLVQYQVSNEELTWAQVFGTMERAKDEYDLEDYSVSQTTLDQVFLNFARAQIAPREEGIMTCKRKCANCCRKCCHCC